MTHVLSTICDNSDVTDHDDKQKIQLIRSNSECLSPSTFQHFIDTILTQQSDSSIHSSTAVHGTRSIIPEKIHSLHCKLLPSLFSHTTLGYCQELLKLLSAFHFYRCHYEKVKFRSQGRVFVPSLKQLFRKCRRYTVDEICNLSHTELWRKVHPVYGAKIRNFICKWTNRPKPKILSRSKIKDTPDSKGLLYLAHTHIPKKVKLYEFFLDLLGEPYYRHAINWVNHENFLFQIKDKNKLTKLWTKVKDNLKASKDNFGHTLRYCEKEGFLMKIEAKRNSFTIFQFTLKSLEQYRDVRQSTRLIPNQQ